MEKLNNKYYIPSIEEFYVGFEYEIWSSKAYTEENWVKETLTLYQGEDLNMLADGCHGLRVKYLDKEDIESLGWKLVSNDTNSLIHEWMFEIEDKVDGSGVWKWLLQLIYPIQSFSVHENVAIYHTHNRNNVCIADNTKFDGTIKNKSKLKKLMQQLHII